MNLQSRADVELGGIILLNSKQIFTKQQTLTSSEPFSSITTYYNCHTKRYVCLLFRKSIWKGLAKAFTSVTGDAAVLSEYPLSQIC